MILNVNSENFEDYNELIKICVDEIQESLIQIKN
jgi:hypothetical protein